MQPSFHFLPDFDFPAQLLFNLRIPPDCPGECLAGNAQPEARVRQELRRPALQQHRSDHELALIVNRAAAFGGDEFGIILGSGMTNEAIFQYAAGISSIFSEPIAMGDNVYTVAASYGAASFPENAMTAEDLFRCAETAMFNAKESGKNQLCFFTGQIK